MYMNVLYEKTANQLFDRKTLENVEMLRIVEQGAARVLLARSEVNS